MYSSLKYRQRRWGDKNVRRGLCRMCGKRRIYKAEYCDVHYAEHAERCRYRYFKAHANVDPYRRVPKERTPRQRACAAAGGHDFRKVAMSRRIWKTPLDADELICARCGYRVIKKKERKR